MAQGRKRYPEQRIVEDLRDSLARLVAEAHERTLSTSRRRALEAEIHQTMNDLASLLNELDPVRRPSSMFDPSNPKVVGRFTALALVAQPRYSMVDVERLYGSGVYAIYYNGENSLYAPIAHSETPIYVGQAAPAVGNARTPLEQGERLTRRLDDHRRNILRANSTIDIADFEYRSLVVQSGWETAAEDYLIHLFQPVWNNETGIVYGLGKHGDAAGTRANRRSPWDTVHPGRQWAADDRLIDAKSSEQIEAELAVHFAQHPVFPDLDSVLSSFVEELRQI